ncbi:hypothetical protein V6N13_098906 [Hibiscus sabdariffa]|uniref:Uncharacterized protein n=1 Tax=Hibiscus sabdariffa TaxID=183260 RepID=A0ABR2EHL5_9ROSI
MRPQVSLSSYSIYECIPLNPYSSSTLCGTGNWQLATGKATCPPITMHSSLKTASYSDPPPSDHKEHQCLHWNQEMMVLLANMQMNINKLLSSIGSMVDPTVAELMLALPPLTSLHTF